MRSWLVIAIACAGACRDAQLAQLEQIRDAVCACTSVECAEAAMKAIPQADVDANRRAQQLAHDMLDCVARIAARPPGPTPGGPGSSDAAPAGTR